MSGDTDAKNRLQGGPYPKSGLSGCCWSVGRW